MHVRTPPTAKSVHMLQRIIHVQSSNQIRTTCTSCAPQEAKINVKHCIILHISKLHTPATNVVRIDVVHNYRLIEMLLQSSEQLHWAAYPTYWFAHNWHTASNEYKNRIGQTDKNWERTDHDLMLLQLSEQLYWAAYPTYSFAHNWPTASNEFKNWLEQKNMTQDKHRENTDHDPVLYS
jgi:hypothetical protein